MNDSSEHPEGLDLGVPAARNALVYAIVGLGITAIVGLLVWDLLGLVFGIPLALFGLARGAMALPKTRAYPHDRVRAIAAIVAGCIALILVVPIWSGAVDHSGEPPPASDSPRSAGTGHLVADSGQ